MRKFKLDNRALIALCTMALCFSVKADERAESGNLKHAIGVSYYSTYVEQYDDFFNGAELSFSRVIAPSIVAKGRVASSEATIAGINVPLQEYELSLLYRHHLTSMSDIDFSLSYLSEHYDFKGLDRKHRGAKALVSYHLYLWQNIETELGVSYKNLGEQDHDVALHGAAYYQYSDAWKITLTGAYSEARPFVMNVGLKYQF